MYVVTELWRYPMKSMQGERVAATTIDAQGFVGDRGRAVVDAQTGKAASGSWAARRWADLVTWSAAYVAEPGGSDPIPEVRVTSPSGERFTVGGPDDDAMLSRHLGRDVRVAVGQQDDAMSGNHPPGTFWDVAPIHVLTTSTLASLAALAPGSAFDARRFRPNLVIDTGGDPGFPENDWLGSMLSIGSDVRLRITGDCPRCVMTTHAQADLPKDNGILQAAARSNASNVGVYAEVVRSGQVYVGDGVRVIREAEVSGAR